MLDILTAAQQRLFDLDNPRDLAVATIISVQGSAPRPVGTSMFVDSAGAVHGSLSGGCVEGAVFEACQETLATGICAVHTFGYSDEDAFAVGLMCGGAIEVLVQPFRIGDADVAQCATQDDPVAMVMRLPSTHREQRSHLAAVRDSDGDGMLAALEPLVEAKALAAVAEQVASMIRHERTGTVRVAAPDGSNEPVELFVETRESPSHLVVVGANAFGQALVEAAKPLGFRITLCDPRSAFADPAAFPDAEVVQAWPHRFLADAAEAGEFDRRTMICILTHDPKIDIPALTCALGLGVGYVGAMGSRRSDRERRSALQRAGVDDEALKRLHSPIGLGLGAQSPAEVAVSILAEILAVQGGHARILPLSRGSQPLHPSTT
ncbi:XdhC family protein [Glutamicibacter sp. BSL13]